ncbi:diguanylate cyclase [Halomonas sp. PAMB 3264]|uniref:GGDEF domain-containing response regulator n=1 Tax=Halomonas sp. PAMB 3264 TaxID=3075222 RepID=UPI00289D074B|nr:diguanylate cyclase [Halomonas sp. PAMB 3264]WNL41913.1 diguanylate cyclase [Halomonas sp. PAMB 3264]
MPSHAQTLHDKLNELRLRFVEQLPERLQAITQQWQQSQASCEARARLAPDLHRFFHSLKGTGRSLGFERLAALAEQGEKLLTSTSAQAHIAPMMDTLLGKLRQEQANLLKQKNQATTHGSSATVELPATALRAGNHRQRLIYLCDDEPEQVSQLLHHLRCFGHEAYHFEDTQTFFNAVLTRRPDAIIMDVQFPQGKTAGPETLASLNKLTGERLPAIVLSSSGDFGSRLSAVRAGCSGYFIKPVKPLEIMLALDKLTAEPDDEPLRVLVVDDEPEAAGYHAALLERAGMITQQAHSPAQAFVTLERFNPDLMLVDMYMPVCSGEELATIVRQQPEYVGLPIIYLSGETDSQKQLTAMNAGVEGFITKPVIPDDLVAAVTLRAERLRHLRALMTQDSMTGLYNHSTTTDLINRTLAQAYRDDTHHAMAMLDIDHFKDINDTYGHLAGDQVIITLAHMLKTRFRTSDIIGRYGGEEFVILMKNVTLDIATRLIERLRQDFEQVDFHAGDARFNCTFSAGISDFPRHPSTETLRVSADQALYRAKSQGRNQLVINTEADALDDQ